MPTTKPAILALADGTVFRGISIGADGLSSGEVVFNTAMTGYQEILTDPSYCRQIVTLTYQHIGNTGTNAEDELGTSQRLQIQDNWPLKPGEKFSQAAWSGAKSGGLKVLQDDQLKDAQIRLAQAGIRSKDWAVAVIFGRMIMPILIGGTAAILLYAVGIYPEWGGAKRFMAFAGALLLAYKAPDIYLKNAITKRVDAIRKAFDQTMKDPEYLAECEKFKIDIEPLSGVEIAELLQKIYKTPADTVERVRKSMEHK